MSFLAFLKRRFNKAFFGSPSTNPVEYIDGRPIIQTTSSDDKDKPKPKPIQEGLTKGNLKPVNRGTSGPPPPPPKPPKK